MLTSGGGKLRGSNENWRICSLHFTPEDFEVSSAKPTLKPHAVPTIFGAAQLNARVSMTRKV